MESIRFCSRHLLVLTINMRKSGRHDNGHHVRNMTHIVPYLSNMFLQTVLKADPERMVHSLFTRCRRRHSVVRHKFIA